MPQRKRHVQRRIVEQVVGTPWQVLPEKMDEIVELLEMRAAGLEFTDEEIAERIGPNDRVDALVIGSRRNDDSEIVMSGSTAIIPIHGTMFQRANLMTRYSGGVSTQQVMRLLTEANNDSRVEQIVLDIDSPGGSALGNEELVQLLMRVRENKEVVASINGLAASAAYYVATGAGTIYASPSSMIGSIGTIIVHRETSQRDQDEGIKFSVIRSGLYKADGNGHEPLSEQSRATLDERVVVYHDQFVAAVAKGRDVSEATVRSEFGDGKVFIAQDALRRGMIDQIGTLNDVIERFSSAAPSQPVSAVFPKENQMDKKLKAALFARGLTQSADVADEIAEAALSAWFTARGMTRPEDAAECLAALNNDYQKPAANAPVATDPEPQPAPAASSVDPDQVRQEERFRINEINAIAQQLGDVPQDSIDAAIEKGLSPEEFSRAAIAARSAAMQPVNPTTIQGIESEVDKFNDSAVAALMSRAGHDPGDTPMGQLEGRSLCDIAQIAVETLSDHRLGRYPRRDQVARAFLGMGGESIQVGMAGSNDPAYHGSGSFPNLLSVLANKMLDMAMEYAPATYSQWTNRLPDVPDFKPATIAGAGEFNHLPQHALGRPFEHSDFDESVSWIQMDSFGNEFVLTPDMIVNDDLDAFTQAMNTRGIAHELTLNKLVIDHLISDPRTADGLTMFDASHGNDITSGGAPDSSQLSENRKAHRRQVGISKKNKLRYEPAIVLVSPEWETQMEQTLQAVIYPETDLAAGANKPNTFRGRYAGIVEPMLDDVSDNKVWYTIVAPSMLRGMVHAFQTGYGQGGRRRSYFREETQCRHFQLEGRFGTSAVNHQAIVRNNGS